jgi:hypothetical protein
VCVCVCACVRLELRWAGNGGDWGCQALRACSLRSKSLRTSERGSLLAKKRYYESRPRFNGQEIRVPSPNRILADSIISGGSPVVRAATPPSPLYLT